MSDDHVVQQGECVSSIAIKNGLFPDAVWDHPENAKLKSERKDPNVLLPGDLVHVPDTVRKEEACATERRHRFRRKGVPAKLLVRLLIDDEPLAHAEYQLLIGDAWHAEGTTDGDGLVEASIPPVAKEGRIVVEHEEQTYVFPLALGTLDPIDTEDGVAKRLADLGYPVGEDLSEAVKQFQEAKGLNASGEIDAATRSAIEREFGR